MIFLKTKSSVFVNDKDFFKQQNLEFKKNALAMLIEINHRQLLLSRDDSRKTHFFGSNCNIANILHFFNVI